MTTGDRGISLQVTGVFIYSEGEETNGSLVEVEAAFTPLPIPEGEHRSVCVLCTSRYRYLDKFSVHAPDVQHISCVLNLLSKSYLCT